jgi:hypothetical protein
MHPAFVVAGAAHTVVEHRRSPVRTTRLMALSEASRSSGWQAWTKPAASAKRMPDVVSRFLISSDQVIE